ncbi:hypothetical protein Cch01nite_16340 [Cellulomonas chitinilytica]|uniref:Lipoprotein n=1 Tax=Cellulomonas chitinilytica TaxID=398759 RepID=A0A919P288_9CELL|nr:hypothetical protein [Cellulomonas chitinilytica]GIG20910.1 hypothetical protein Cch01nite_16340 [Cellulomonas chitinilytica]
MPRRRWPDALLLLTATGLVAVLSACSPTSTPDAVPTSGLSPLEQSAASAREAGVDEAQLAILESGSVGFEDYELAMNRAYECMRAAGVDVDVRGVKPYHGVTILDVTIEGGGHADALAEDCYERHARYVDAYWQVSSPDAVAYAERRAVALKPALQQCLTDQDVDWPQDASFEELGNLAFGPGTDPEQSCFEQIGYSQWEG